MLYQSPKRTSLRFRRWSRKSYASFITIGRLITIGRVKSIVADSLLRKQKRTVPPFNILSFFLENALAELDDPPEVELSLQLTVPLFYNKKNYDERFMASPLKPVFSKWLKASTPMAFSHFYFLTTKTRIKNN